MSKFDLSALNATHPLILEIKETLEKATKQRANTPEVQKMKKTAGVATKDAFFSLEEGQTITLTFRTDGDVVKVILNKKVIPLRNVMDYDDMPSFKAGIEDLALQIKANQPKFDIQRQKQKVAVPNDPSKRKASLKKQTEALNERLGEINVQIAEKTNLLAAKQQEFEALQQGDGN